ncbi:PH domain-containing protein [Saccharothrix violaceirubra]|uniref:Low molecular weight protein antigen 6 PH domain-containing protein n=1 Tax=Saccharothrix violaceirubra TaxID=413306 RepID=A0A7W7T9Y6_9PSEU|nr:PH domain-containing protein [Saccharothrix violaceirubra]MBB4969269.1 hypothetical protein [Saccharothrix violaceirubra]
MTPARTWSPKRAIVVVDAVLVALALVAVPFTTDATGRVLLVVLAALGALWTAHFAVRRLTADDTGLTLGTLTGAKHLPWHEVKIKLVHTRRLGREVATLELDWARGDDEKLYVLTPFDLGTDPVEVTDVLHALRP